MVFDSVLPIKPNKMQVKAMENLKRLRDHGEPVIIVMGAINAFKSRVSGTFAKYN